MSDLWGFSLPFSVIEGKEDVDLNHFSTIYKQAGTEHDAIY